MTHGLDAFDEETRRMVERAMAKKRGERAAYSKRRPEAADACMRAIDAERDLLGLTVTPRDLTSRMLARFKVSKQQLRAARVRASAKPPPP